MALIRTGGGSSGVIPVEAGHFIQTGYNSGDGSFTLNTAYTSGTAVSYHATNYCANLVIPKCSAVSVTCPNAANASINTVKNGVATKIASADGTVSASITDCDYVIVTIYAAGGVNGTVTITD